MSGQDTPDFLEDQVRAKKAVISVGSAAVVTGAAVTGLTGIASAMAAPVHGLYGPKAADRAAVAYVRQHCRGSARVRVLATERDVERGYRVYDVRLAAPNHIIYVAHVSRVSDKVLWIDKAESHGRGGGAVTAAATATATSVSADRAARGDKAPDHKSDRGDYQDRKDHQDGGEGGNQHDS
ncbi:MAG: hypothetical protein ACYCO9_06995 [Streptosporangiaceae bacterium]